MGYDWEYFESRMPFIDCNGERVFTDPRVSALLDLHRRVKSIEEGSLAVQCTQGPATVQKTGDNEWTVSPNFPRTVSTEEVPDPRAEFLDWINASLGAMDIVAIRGDTPKCCMDETTATLRRVRAKFTDLFGEEAPDAP